MKVNYEHMHDGRSLIIQTKDWGKYAVNRFAVPCIDNYSGKFKDSQSPPFTDLIDSLDMYGTLFVMKKIKNVFFDDMTKKEIDKFFASNSSYHDYPCDIIAGELVTNVSPVLFEKIFKKSEISKISMETIHYLDKKEGQNVYTIKEPKITLLGGLGMYLDSKFK